MSWDCDDGGIPSREIQTVIVDRLTLTGLVSLDNSRGLISSMVRAMRPAHRLMMAELCCCCYSAGEDRSDCWNIFDDC